MIVPGDTIAYSIIRNHHPANGSPGSSRERERVKSGRTKASRKQKRILRSALEKAGEVALRLTMEVSAGVKAFDGPPLKPSDVKDLFLRNFRVRLSASEAEALIMHFTSSTTMVRGCTSVGPDLKTLVKLGSRPTISKPVNRISSQCEDSNLLCIDFLLFVELSMLSTPFRLPS